MFGKILCLLNRHERVSTISEEEAKYTNKEGIFLGKLVGANPTEEAIKRAESHPDEKSTLINIKVHCARCGKTLPNFKEIAEYYHKHRN